jgi:hypothetical protein
MKRNIPKNTEMSMFEQLLGPMTLVVFNPTTQAAAYETISFNDLLSSQVDQPGRARMDRRPVIIRLNDSIETPAEEKV